jgi:hypothetical protein
MNFPATFPVVLALAAVAFFCAPASSQQPKIIQNPATSQPRQVRQPAQHPMPFSAGGQSTAPADALVFRPLDQMTPQDRELAAGAESVIAERTGFVGLDFPQGGWSYQQLLCSALPNHLFLQFTRDGGTGSASVFSASIPRDGAGRVRVIPILRRGYSLFSPAPVNAQTISAFNHIRAEEHPAQAPEWLATGLCYAALAGAHPLMGPSEESEIRKLPAAPPGRLVVQPQGGAVIFFTDLSALPRPMQWTMTFDAGGKLLKAAHAAAPKSRAKVAVRTPAEAKGKPVTHSTGEPQGKPVTNAAGEAQGRPVPQKSGEPKGKPVKQKNQAPVATSVP